MSEQQDFVGMLLLAAVWGYTNVWMAKATREKEENAGEKEKKPATTSWYLRPVLELINYFKNWRFVLPFLLNQSASVLFLYFVIKTDLSKAVCTINSLTFMFTASFGYLFFGEQLNWTRTLIGSGFILAGIGVKQGWMEELL
ncbi:unnamed protein product [Bursaphelenchus okinawaensis]|uniref:EamA domain-containing protein n=1 Tax=Bursaphelenchus okinawaensis TaxID=465554 RepID=A0A811JRP3_9BILA|nr:unnamed protein product [Bursaphelenchus okinawaensis]CAG9080123.1 unnamed protein product [Bursaphelenchus okinawaensis]